MAHAKHLISAFITASALSAAAIAENQSLLFQAEGYTEAGERMSLFQRNGHDHMLPAEKRSWAIFVTPAGKESHILAAGEQWTNFDVAAQDKAPPKTPLRFSIDELSCGDYSKNMQAYDVVSDHMQHFGMAAHGMGNFGDLAILYGGTDGEKPWALVRSVTTPDTAGYCVLAHGTGFAWAKPEPAPRR